MQKKLLRKRRHRKVRAKVKGSKKRLRLSVFKGNKHIYVQLIDDFVGRTLVEADDLKLKDLNKVDTANEVGKLIAKKALAKKIKFVVFDRGGYKYSGRVKAIADGARKGGLIF